MGARRRIVWTAFALTIGCVFTLGCARPDAPDANGGVVRDSVVDDRGVAVDTRPARKRIVSLVPSATELLLALGAGDRLVARTRFDSDARLVGLPSVGGGRDPSLETLLVLDTDLVITWHEIDSGLSSRLETLGVSVYALTARTIADVLRHAEALGALTGLERSATAFADSLQSGMDALHERTREGEKISVLYVLWPDPLTTTGPGTFIAEVIDAGGGYVLFHDVDTVWPVVSLEDVLVRDPDVILVASDGGVSVSGPWEDPESAWSGLTAVREGRVHFVEGDLFNRPGARILEAALLTERLLRAPGELEASAADGR